MPNYSFNLNIDNTKTLLEQRMALIEQVSGGPEKLAMSREAPTLAAVAREQCVAVFLSYALGQSPTEIRTAAKNYLNTQIRALQYGASMSALRFIDALALAMIAGEKSKTTQLCSFDKDQYTSPSSADHEFEILMADVLRFLISGKQQEAEKLCSKLAKVLPRTTTPPAIALRFMQLGAATSAFLKASEPDLNLALTTRQMDLAREFQIRTPKISETNYWMLLDCAGFILAALGKQRDMLITIKSPMLPQELILPQ